MDSDIVYQYTKLFIENAWAVAGIAAAVWLLTRPNFLDRITSFEVMNFKVQLRALEEKLEAAQVEIDRVQSRNAELSAVVSSLDADAPVAELQTARAQLKQVARTLDERDLEQVLDGLQPGASPEQVYAAAVIVRARRDPALFDSLISCLDQLAGDKNLLGVRLHTVWTLTSALHLTLVSDSQAETAVLTQKQLADARSMLAKLIENPRVLNDRPDAPSKGVRGPAMNAMKQIDKALKLRT